MVSFEDYLKAKKIDPVAFRQAEPERWDAWKREFEQLHANSFTMQKLNLINAIRRKYRLVAPVEPKAPAAKPAQPSRPAPAKVVMRPKRDPDSSA